MSKQLECKYSPLCAREGCHLLAEVIHQSKSGGARTAKLANMPPTAKLESGKFWKRSGWAGTTLNYESRAPRLGCTQLPKLKEGIQKETRRKNSLGELV